MSGGMYGADIEALRLLADRFDEGSGTLDTAVAAVEAAIPQEDGWSGPDAEGFRQEWTGSHLLRLKDTAAALSDVAIKVRANADAQDATSNEYVGGPGAGPGTGPGDGSGFPSAVDDGGVGLGALGLMGLKAVTLGLAGFKGWKTGSALTTFLRAKMARDSMAAFKATTEVYRGAGGLVGQTASKLGFADDLGLLGKLGTGIGTAGRVLGGVGGVFGIVGGVNQIFNSQYDGARGTIDQVMGGVSIVGGAGGIALALGGAALLGPVGVGIVIGAGVAAGAWALGNMVADAWGPEISGAASAAWDWAGDTTGDIGEGIGNMAETAGDVASDVGDAVGDGLDAAGDFVGGLFS